MIKTRVTPQSNTFNVTIPNEYVGKDIEILIYKTDEAKNTPLTDSTKPKSTLAEFWGILSDDAAKDLNKTVIELRDGWEDRINKQF